MTWLDALLDEPFVCITDMLRRFAGERGDHAALICEGEVLSLTLLDRKKDMIISGGFNVYPSDLETEIRAHPDVADVAVVGARPAQWGETPVAFVVRRPLARIDADTLLAWVNARVGKMQRLSALTFVDSLPRSPIGKVLKRELRERF